MEVLREHDWMSGQEIRRLNFGPRPKTAYVERRLMLVNECRDAMMTVRPIAEQFLELRQNGWRLKAKIFTPEETVYKFFKPEGAQNG